MQQYSNGPDAISGLHRNGFTNDFQLLGNDLLWVQEKVFIRAGEFSILEHHKMPDPNDPKSELSILGVAAPWLNIKGILISHHNSHSENRSPVLVKKLKELCISSGNAY